MKKENYEEVKITLEDYIKDNYDQKYKEIFEELFEDLISSEVDKHITLMEYLEITYGQLEGFNKFETNNNEIKINGEAYMVLTNREAKERHLEYVKNSFDDNGIEWFDGVCSQIIQDKNGDIKILSSVDIYSRDRGSSLSGHDGTEEELNGFYIYRML